MGYDVRLTKPELPGQEPELFTEREWRAFQAKHADIDYVYFSAGHIVCKNPSEAQLAALAKLAYARGWRLRGDDGEYYDDSGNVIQEEAPAPQGFFSRVKHAFAERRAARELASEMAGVEPAFRVGDRVKFLHRSGGVVVKVNKQANSGLGEIRVRFPDGAELSGMFPDGGFEPEP